MSKNLELLRQFDQSLVRPQKPLLVSSLPSHMRDMGDDWMRGVLATVKADPKLMQAAMNNGEAFISAIQKAASLGLAPGTDEFYLVPYGKQINAVTGYKGLIELIYRAGRVDGRVRADLGVGDGDAVEVRARHSLRVREIGVDVYAEARRVVRPLALEVLGGAHDGEFVDGPLGDELGGQGEGEGGLAGAGGGHGQEVARGAARVGVEGARLPGPQPTVRRAPRQCRAHSPDPGFPPSEKGQLRPFLPIESRSSLHVGHTGYFEASRVGIHTLPHRATTGWPVTIEESALSRRTKWANRSPSPGDFSCSTSVRSSRPVEDWVEGPPGPVGSSRASRMGPL